MYVGNNNYVSVITNVISNQALICETIQKYFASVYLIEKHFNV